MLPPESEDIRIEPATATPERRRRQIMLPTRDGWVWMEGHFPLSAGAWDELLNVLAAMKGGLVAPDSKDEA